MVGDLERAFSRGIGQNDGKLFAAEAGDKVAGALDDVLNGLGYLLEATVSAQMAKGIVVELEPVGVDHEEREGQAFTPGATPLVREVVVKAAAVGYAGEGIGHGEGFDSAISILQLSLGLFALGDVIEEPDAAEILPAGGEQRHGVTLDNTSVGRFKLIMTCLVGMIIEIPNLW